MLKPVSRNHIKEILFCFFLLIASGIALSQGTWQRIDFPSNQLLRSVFFTDSLFGWIAGDSGTIFHTTDSGNTWIKQESKTQNEIVDLFFLNRNLGWASSFNYRVVPYGTELLKTKNGGAEWTLEKYPDENIFINCILFLDSLNGWMGGRPHALVKTTNGGIDWHQAEIDTSTLAFFPVLGIQFYNGKYGYACGGMFDIAGVIWRTSDGGNKWYAIDPAFAPADEVHALHIFDSLHVMGAGGDPDFGYGVGMIRTSDGGLSWNYEELGMPGYAVDLDFRNKNEAWASLGPRRKFIYSLDAGTTWTVTPTPDSATIYDVTFPDSLHGFAVGKDGVVLKYLPKITGVIETEYNLKDNFILYQNYPNPFHSSTVLNFKVPSRMIDQNNVRRKQLTTIKVCVYNLFGEEVASLTDHEIFPGEHKIIFNPKELPSGIYFYKLTGDPSGYQETLTLPRKMILIR